MPSICTCRSGTREGVSPSPIPSYISAQFDIPLAGLTYNDIAYLARAYNISRGQSGDAL